MPKRKSKANPSKLPILTRNKKKTYIEKSLDRHMKLLKKPQRGGKS